MRPSVRPLVCVSEDELQFLQANHKMSLIKVVPYVLGVTPGVSGTPEPKMYPHSGYFLVFDKVKKPSLKEKKGERL